jgi:hypothetical protein
MQNHTTVLVAALAAALVVMGIVAIATSATASGENSVISVPTITTQKQKCQSAGSVSPIDSSCTATSTNTIDESGGVLGGPK